MGAIWDCACLAGVFAGSAAAADLPSLKQLLGSGYEIKAVTFIPVDALSAMGLDPKSPQVIITLQRGAAIAACQYLASNSSTLPPASVEGRHPVRHLAQGLQSEIAACGRRAIR